jgi:hypothetical protein
VFEVIMKLSIVASLIVIGVGLCINAWELSVLGLIVLVFVTRN